jgi:hypothetical protein
VRLAPTVKQLVQFDGREFERDRRPFFVLFEQQVGKRLNQIEEKIRLAGTGGTRGAHVCSP